MISLKRRSINRNLENAAASFTQVVPLEIQKLACSVMIICAGQLSQLKINCLELVRSSMMKNDSYHICLFLILLD